MSYALRFRGFGQSVSREDCIEAGGIPKSDGGCEGVARAQCERAGGTWDAAQLVCRGIGKNKPAPQLCADRGGEWDPDQRLCYDPSTGTQMSSSTAVAAEKAFPIVLVAGAAGLAWWLLER